MHDAVYTERFWAKVNKDGPVPEHRPELGPCWVWTAFRDRDGYGMFHVEGNRGIRAHRFSLEMVAGHLLNPGVFVLHRCDNPSCVKPDHLFAGTAQDNSDDMIAKGRQRFIAGTPAWRESHAMGIAATPHWATARPEKIKRGDAWPTTRLSDAQVREIRARWATGGITQTAMATEYGVSFQHISQICSGKSRKHA